MPSKSKAQHRLMQAVAHNPEFAKKVKIPVSVGKDFSEADKGKTFRKGGTTNPSMSSINKQQTHHGKIQLPNVSLNKYIGKKEGGMTHDDVKQDKAMIKKAVKMHDDQLHGGKNTDLKGLKKGGACMANGGYVRAADGIAKRGKTRGTMV